MLSKKLGRSFGRQIIGVALLLAAGFVFFVLQPDFALAQIDTSSADTTAATAELADAELTTIISNIIFGLLGFLGVIFLVIVIYAGFLWMTAGGDEDQITKAKKWIINGVIGLLIIMAAYAITTFIINVLTGQFAGGGAGGSGDDGANNGQQVSAPALSGSLGRGIITHRPYRNEQDVVRNTSISVTFADEMDPASFIQGYDPTAANPAGDLNTNNVKIYETEQGENRAYESDEVRVTFTDDKKIFTFYPPLLGSSLEDTNISVFLAPMIENANEENVLDQDGYLWTFTVGTELDLTPPRIVSVLPAADGQYGRNIAVQMTFSEPVDPTSASGAFDPAVSEADFDNIKAVGANSGDLAGEYFISNEYRTVTFLTNDSCGTNSCGQEMFCLPANETVTMTIYGATPAANQNDWPASSGFPFDGVVDMAGNSFDGDGNWGDPEGGDIGDEYSWSFTTTGQIILGGPVITSTAPDLNNVDNVSLDQPVTITFDDILLINTVTSENITLHSRIVEQPDLPQAHELPYSCRAENLPTGTPTYTEVEVVHGILLESTEGNTYQYRLGVGENLKNQYQNCYDPAQGPGVSGDCGTDAVSKPWCCQGVASSQPCISF